jgi:hypothetical protein
MRKAVEKIEAFDSGMLNYLSKAPVAELVTRARADYLSVRLNPTRDKIKLAGAQAQIDRWTQVIKPRRDEVIQFLLAELGEQPPEEDHAEVLLSDVMSCPACGQIIAPPPAIQIRNYRDWQRGMPVLWQWSDREMSRLEMTLQPGDLIIFPSYAQSCVIKRLNGTLENWPRCQG